MSVSGAVNGTQVGPGTTAIIGGGGRLAAETSRQTYDSTRYTTEYGYDAVGNMTVITDANGVVTHLAYDGVNRLTQVTYPDSQVSYAYDSVNNRTAMTDTTGTTAYAYDAVGRMTSVTPPGQSQVQYGYNDAGQRNLLTYPSGEQVQYAYDPVGRLNRVTDWSQHQVTYSYDDAGRLTGASLPNNTSASYTYDNANRLTRLAHTSVVSGTINSFDYALDNVGNRVAMTDTSGVTSYSYDNLHRLSQVTYPNSATTRYGYDAVGNRTVLTDATGTTNYTYDASNRLQAAGNVSFTWDQNGNMTSKVAPTGTTTYTYDTANRLTQVNAGTGTYQYTYNGDGLRTRKTANGTSTDYTWDAATGMPVVIKDTNDLYLYGLDLIAQQNGGEMAYYHPDGLGTIRNLTNSSGRVIVNYSYDAFGKAKSSSGSWNNDFRFTGEQLDSETGLYYLRARYYDPSTGRFITKDPFKGIVRAPGTLNQYPYVTNMPTNLTDPNGLWGGGVGGNGIIGAGYFGEAAWFPLVITENGDIGMVFVIAGGGMAGINASLSGGFLGSDNVRSLKDFEGLSMVGGVTVDAIVGITGEGFLSKANQDCVQIRGGSLTFGPGGGFGVYGGPAKTWTYKMGNYNDLLRRLRGDPEALPSGRSGFR